MKRSLVSSYAKLAFRKTRRICEDEREINKIYKEADHEKNILIGSAIRRCF